MFATTEGDLQGCISFFSSFASPPLLPQFQRSLWGWKLYQRVQLHGSVSILFIFIERLIKTSIITIPQSKTLALKHIQRITFFPFSRTNIPFNEIIKKKIDTKLKSSTFLINLTCKSNKAMILWDYEMWLKLKPIFWWAPHLKIYHKDWTFSIMMHWDWKACKICNTFEGPNSQHGKPLTLQVVLRIARARERDNNKWWGFKELLRWRRKRVESGDTDHMVAKFQRGERRWWHYDRVLKATLSLLLRKYYKRLEKTIKTQTR